MCFPAALGLTIPANYLLIAARLEELWPPHDHPRLAERWAGLRRVALERIRQQEPLDPKFTNEIRRGAPFTRRADVARMPDGLMLHGKMRLVRLIV
jgi:hypothetical protein